MSKYQSYDEYKPSEIDWLEYIPKHWCTSKLRYLFSFGKGLTITKENLQDDGIPCVSYGEVHSKYGFEVNPQKHPLKCVHEDYLKTTPSALIEAGDIVFADTSEDIDGSGNFTQLIGEERIFAGYHTIIARPVDKECARFYAYLLDSIELRTQIRHSVKGVKVFSITQAILRGVNVWLPPMYERIQIANFLDHEIAKIDTLIEKQQRLIQLLKEKRQSVISHAVTKGLNPDAPMKPSGVEWLGDVPEHWAVSRIKNFAKIDSGHTPSRKIEEYWTNCYIPWVSLNDSKILKVVDYIDDTSNKINELGMANSSAHLLPEKSVVFTRDASIGLSAIISKPMAVSQHLIAWICDDSKLIPEFLLLIFYAMEKEFERYTFGATIKTIGMDDVRSLSGAFPIIEEQQALVDWAFKKMASLKNGIEKAESVVELLKERRIALISAAVTGKIDVRNWQTLAEPQQEATVQTV
ncbi:restriction endonuclease subunit S [Vibrio mimicus]|uniref:restriction endonuclease subunit S n=1 Tax=Vibrio mimicus TaxID=674 RepID=UPI002FF24DC5